MPQKIALDAMGGDHAPGEIIRGAVIAAEKLEGVEIILIGEEKIIKEELHKAGSTIPFEIVHTDEWITMEEDPKEAVKTKENASINLAAKMVNENHVDAMVSAGNT